MKLELMSTLQSMLIEISITLIILKDIGFTT